MKVLLDIIHRLDVYIAVAGVAKAKGFVFAHALPKDRNILDVKGFHHPSLPKGVNNDLTFNQGNNVLFLTGANMAGKSTLMKSFGIAVYLAHMGFPVAAEKMEFSIRDGLYSSINVPDNISQGYSHFYAEVLRVKKIAEEVSSSRDLVVIFDELFKGTNVKDAYDATLAVTEAFSDFRNCFFIISTHIIEVGEQLMKGNQHIQFSYLPTIMDGVMPRYTYKLQEGITSDRHGMMIIHNERILEIIKGAICTY
jgi:DNA mismatch repair ATPase MutS